ncbi:MAG: DUF503 domain-containing protein [Candidatus Aminicenantes bacterium]|nr:DUF503 domain-containing protein [Candidatus Aminicenantes bacterium]
MVVGLLTLDLHFPHARSLKDKRKELASLKDRLRHGFNAAVAELAYQDVWQRTSLGIVTLNSQQAVVEQILASARRDVENHLNGVVINADLRFF